MKDYETIPLKFRHALQTAFPKLIIHTVETEEPAPFEPDFDLGAPVETQPKGDLIALDLDVVPPSCPNPKFPVNARALHTYMQIGKDFSNWMKDRIKKFQFIEDVDYGVFAKSGENPQGGRPSIEYWLTGTTARMMAADVNSARGVEVIKFLVARHERLEALEKVGQPALKLPQTYIEALRALADTEEKAQQLKIQNLAANQVIGETRAQLVHTEIKLETAEDQVEILLNKIELSV